MNGRATDKRYASAKRLEVLEQTVENMQAAIDSQTAVIVDLRERILPTPVELGFVRNQSTAVRHFHGVEV